MSVEIASLRIEVDATPANAAKVSLDDLTRSGAALEQQAGKIARSQRDVGSAYGLVGTAAGQAERSMRSLVGVYDTARDALGRFTSTDGSFRLSQEATATVMLRNASAVAALAKEQDRTAAQVARLTSSYDPLAGAVLKANNELERAGRLFSQGKLSAEQYAAATTGLTQKMANLREAQNSTAGSGKALQQLALNTGRQLTDIGVQLAGGQSPFLILTQQLPQVADGFAVAGQQGLGFKAALAGIVEAATPILAIAGPVIAVVGAIAAAAVAFNQGDKEAAKLANTLALAGSNAGLTAVQFEVMSRAAAGNAKSSIDEARKALLGLVETGKISGEAVQALGEDVITFARLTGKSTKEAVGYFAEMGNGATDFLVKFQQAYGGVRLAQIEHIQLLERQGATTQAQIEAAILVHERLGKAGPENLGYLEKAWRGVADGIKDAWSWLKMWGNEAAGRANQMSNIQKEISANNEKLAANPATGKGSSFLDDEKRQLQSRNIVLGATLNSLKAVEAAERKRATDEAAANQAQIDGTSAALEHANSWAKIAKNVGLANQEIERYRKGQADIRAANPASKELDSPTQAAAIEAAIRKRYERLRTDSGAAARAVRAENRGDNTLEQAKAAELAAQAVNARTAEQLAGIRVEQVKQELEGQKTRLLGLAEEKKISGAAAEASIKAYERVASAKTATVNQQLLADQIARQRAFEDTITGFTDRQVQSQAVLASSLEEAQKIENAALADRQRRAQDRRDFDLFLEWADGKRTEAEVRQVQDSAAAADLGDRMVKAHQDRLAIFQRDLALTQAGYANQVDILNSQKGLAQSAYEAGQLDRRIENLQYVARKDSLSKTIANTDIQDAQHAIAVGDLATLEAIHANNLRALDLSDNMVAAYSDAVQALAGLASSIQQGDLGGSISGLGSVLKQVSGLAGGLNTSVGAALGGAASVLGPVGAAVSAVTGVLGAIGASSAAKAEKKIEALTKAVEDLRTSNMESSGSISAALAEANKNWNSDLEYSSAMLTSLRSIDAKTGVVAATIARAITSGGLLSTKGLGLGSTSSTGSLSAGLVAGGLTGAALAGGTSLLLSGFAGELALGPIGLVAGAVGALIGALTKTKKTVEVLDQGLSFNATTFGLIAQGGVTGSTYADLLTTTKKSILGIGYSTKVNTSTVTGAIDPGLLGQITGVIQLIGKGVLDAAAVFGKEAAKSAESALGSAVVDLGKLSLKDLKPEEIEKAINALFDKVADDLAAAGVPGLDALATAGEGAFETLTRVAREYQVVDVALASIGKTFGQIGLESIAARDALVQLFGGMDAFTAQTSYFAQHFLTDAEQLAPVIKAVNDNLKDYGLTAESSRDQFKALVLAQDLTTEAGRATYAALLAVAPAFDKVATSADDAAEKIKTTIASAAAAMVDAAEKRVDDARSALQASYEAEKTRLQGIVDAASAAEAALKSAYDAQATGLQSTIDKLTSFSQSVKDFSRSLSTGDLAGGSPAQRAALASAEFSRVFAAALSGDETARGQYQGSAQDFLKTQADSSRTALGYAAAVARVQDANDKLGKAADTQASLAQQQLTQLKAQVGALIDLGGGIESVEAAINGLLTARGAAAIAKDQLKALDAQVAGLLTVNESVLSVKDAIVGLNAAIKALADAKTVQANGTGWVSPTGGVAVPTNPNYTNPYGANGSLLGVEGLLGKNAAGQATFDGFTAAELAWVNSPLELGGEKTSAAQAIQQLKAMYGPNVLPGFAKGGSFTIGGFGGVDQNLMSINGQPAAMVGQGEIVTITPAGSNDNSAAVLLAEVTALRKEVAMLRQDRRAADLPTIKSLKRLVEIEEDREELGMLVHGEEGGLLVREA